MLAGSGATHTVDLVRPSKYAVDSAPPHKITITGEAHAVLQRFVKKHSFSVVELLPTELMLLILLEVWKTWPRATRTLRVSKGLAECAAEARGRLPPGEWWTGSDPPLAVPKVSPKEQRINLDAELPALGVSRLGVTAADADDVHKTLLRVPRAPPFCVLACRIVGSFAAPRRAGGRHAAAHNPCCDRAVPCRAAPAVHPGQPLTCT